MSRRGRKSKLLEWVRSVLQALNESPLSWSELRMKTGLHNYALHHALTYLLRENFVMYDKKSGRYYSSERILLLGGLREIVEKIGQMADEALTSSQTFGIGVDIYSGIRAIYFSPLVGYEDELPEGARLAISGLHDFLREAYTLAFMRRLSPEERREFAGLLAMLAQFGWLMDVACKGWESHIGESRPPISPDFYLNPEKRCEYPFITPAEALRSPFHFEKMGEDMFVGLINRVCGEEKIFFEEENYERIRAKATTILKTEILPEWFERIKSLGGEVNQEEINSLADLLFSTQHLQLYSKFIDALFNPERLACIIIAYPSILSNLPPIKDAKKERNRDRFWVSVKKEASSVNNAS